MSGHRAEFLGPDASEKWHHRRVRGPQVRDPVTERRLGDGLRQVAEEISRATGCKVEELPGGTFTFKSRGEANGAQKDS